MSYGGYGCYNDGWSVSNMNCCGDGCSCDNSGWPDSIRCNCCAGGGVCWPNTGSGAGNETVTETISAPCCNANSCCACKKIGGDAPWLQPKAIGCGRTHKCNFKWEFALHSEDLDLGDLPGRPPHTIVCVRAKGKTESRVIRELMCGQPGITDPCDSYDLYICVKVPVEIIIRDCIGFMYCLSSMFSQIVRIPLATRARNLKETLLYVKVRVKLCHTVPVTFPNDVCTTTPGTGTNICHPPTQVIPALVPAVPPAPAACLGAQAEDIIKNNGGCSDLGYATTGSGFGKYNGADRALPSVDLDLLIEACVMKLVPYGVIGDPYCPNNKNEATCVNC